MKSEKSKLTMIFLGVLYLIYKIFDLKHKVEHLNRGQSDVHVDHIGNAIANRINGLSNKVDDLKSKIPADNSEVLVKLSELSNDLEELKNKPHVSVDQIGNLSAQVSQIGLDVVNIKNEVQELRYSHPA